MNLFGSDGLRAGVVGLGSVAHTAHLPTYDAHPEATLAAVADLDAERRESVREEYGVDATYESGAEMIEDADLDLLSICTPPGTHRDLFVTAAEAGCHVYCEKPMTTTVADGEAMVAAAEDAGIITQMGYTRPYVENFRNVLSMLDHHLLGNLKRLQTHRVRNSPAGGWNYDPDLSGGGVVADQLPHIMDFYIRVFGTTPEIEAVALESLDVPAVEDYAELAFDFDGVHVETVLHWTLHTKYQRNVLLGTKGSVEFNMTRLDAEIQSEPVAQKYGQLPFVDLRDQFRAWWGGDDDFHGKRVWDFVDHVAADDHDTVAPVERGLEVTQVLREVYERGEMDV